MGNDPSKQGTLPDPDAGVPERDSFEVESEAEEEIDLDYDEDMSFSAMLAGPKESSPIPCSLCGIRMRLRRWRCWDCYEDMCGACRRLQQPDQGEASLDCKHRDHLISRDTVENQQPARGRTVRKVLLNALNQYSDRPCFGLIRKRSDDAHVSHDLDCSFPKATADSHQWYSYGYLLERVRRLAVRLPSLVSDDTKLAICGENGLEWIATDLACLMQGVASVPINPLFSVKQLEAILGRTDITCVVCGAEHIAKFLQASQAEGAILTTIVQAYRREEGVQHELDPEHVALAKEYGLQLLLLTQQEEEGKQALADGAKAINPTTNKPTTLLTIGWTGGTTGPPKGCMIPERSWCKRLSSFFPKNAPIVQIVFEPLTHFNGRKQVLECLVQGGRTVLWEPASRSTPKATLFSSPSAPPSSTGHVLSSLPSVTVLRILSSLPDLHDARSIFTNIALVRPSRLFALPLLWNTLYDHFNYILGQMVALEDNPSQARLNDVRQELLFAFNQLFGKRLRIIQSGSAALSQVVWDWLREVFPHPCMVSNAYGTTETGGICNDGQTVDGIEIRLRDLPDMGYSNSDKPWPRGELIVKAPNLGLGYWQDEEATQKCFLEKGWYATGDVAELRTTIEYPRGLSAEEASAQGLNGCPKREVILVDRVKSLWKVASGEYLCPEKVEGILMSSPWVSQVVLVGDASLNFPVAIAVPSAVFVEHIRRTHGNLAKEAEVMLAEFTRLALDNGLLDFETPQKVHVEHQPFAVHNGYLTAKLTLHRQNIRKGYGHLVAELAQSKITCI